MKIENETKKESIYHPNDMLESIDNAPTIPAVPLELRVETMGLIEAAEQKLHAHGYCLDCAHEKDGDCEVPEYPLVYGHCDNWRWQHADRYEKLKAAIVGMEDKTE